MIFEEKSLEFGFHCEYLILYGNVLHPCMARPVRWKVTYAPTDGLVSGQNGNPNFVCDAHRGELLRLVIPREIPSVLQRIWVVCLRPTGGGALSPIGKQRGGHKSEESAVGEAKVLALSNPGVMVCVLESILAVGAFSGRDGVSEVLLDEFPER